VVEVVDDIEQAEGRFIILSLPPESQTIGPFSPQPLAGLYPQANLQPLENTVVTLMAPQKAGPGDLCAHVLQDFSRRVSRFLFSYSRPAKLS
jgi:hypothetical protein